MLRTHIDTNIKQSSSDSAVATVNMAWLGRRRVLPTPSGKLACTEPPLIST